MSGLAAVVAGFASGVFLRSLFYFSWPPLAFALVLAALCGGAYVFAGRRSMLYAGLFCALAALGGLRMSLADTPLPESFARDLGTRASYEGVVARDPDVRDGNERVAVRVASGGDSVLILAVVPRGTTAGVGDRVRIRGTLEAPQPFTDDSGRLFRYDAYLQSSGIRFLLNYASLSMLERAPAYSLPALLSRAKQSFIRGIDAALPEPNASLASGIIIGGKSGLGPELQDAFVRSGLIQVIVLSGYNVMVIAEWVMAALGALGIPRRLASGAGALALLLFVGAAGAGATALRAAVMALIALYARATNRTYAAGRALFAAVFLMLLVNPLYLVFDPGFGLSVAATAGLIWLAPLLEPRLAFVRSPFLKNTIATTLAAQLSVLPLLLYDTGTLSLAALPANILVMPVVPLAMAFSALAGLAGMLLPAVLSIVCALPAYALTGYLTVVAQSAAALPGAALSIPPLSFGIVVLLYAALFIASSKRFSSTLPLRFLKKASM